MNLKSFDKLKGNITDMQGWIFLLEGFGTAVRKILCYRVSKHVGHMWPAKAFCAACDTF